MRRRDQPKRNRDIDPIAGDTIIPRLDAPADLRFRPEYPLPFELIRQLHEREMTGKRVAVQAVDKSVNELRRVAVQHEDKRAMYVVPYMIFQLESDAALLLGAVDQVGHQCRPRRNSRSRRVLLKSAVVPMLRNLDPRPAQRLEYSIQPSGRVVLRHDVMDALEVVGDAVRIGQLRLDPERQDGLALRGGEIDFLADILALKRVPGRDQEQHGAALDATHDFAAPFRSAWNLIAVDPDIDRARLQTLDNVQHSVAIFTGV